jgi:hypothetical protein
MRGRASRVIVLGRGWSGRGDVWRVAPAEVLANWSCVSPGVSREELFHPRQIRWDRCNLRQIKAVK